MRIEESGAALPRTESPLPTGTRRKPPRRLPALLAGVVAIVAVAGLTACGEAKAPPAASSHDGRAASSHASTGGPATGGSAASGSSSQTADSSSVAGAASSSGGTTAVAPLAAIDAKCPWAVQGDAPAAVQDGGNGLQPLSLVPPEPSASAVKCAVARAEAAGYSVMPDTEYTRKLATVLHPRYYGSLDWTFHPLYLTTNPAPDKYSSCWGAFIVYDYQGNFAWSDAESSILTSTFDPLNWINPPASKLNTLSIFDGC